MDRSTEPCGECLMCEQGRPERCSKPRRVALTVYQEQTGKFRITRCVEGEYGHEPMALTGDEGPLKQIVNRVNESRGLSEKDVALIVGSTMNEKNRRQ